jgi:cytochrome c oxidase accessory protein FixG
MTNSSNENIRNSDKIAVTNVSDEQNSSGLEGGVQEFHPDGVSDLDLYQKREKIYTRNIKGFFQRLRLYTGWPLLVGYFLLPWINWDHHQAVLFDLPSRQFYIFGLTFWPQDFSLLAGLLAIAAFGLFTVTVFAGRVWCGYTCPQTVWTAMFMWAEQITEGSRNQRIKLDNSPFSWNKLWRRSLKHGLWIGISLVTGFTFVAYFSPVRELLPNLLTVTADGWGPFINDGQGLGWWELAWINFFTCATYINAGWLREQVCMYMCPYARFQSVMFDKDTLIVSYDYRRGENRGARKKGSDYKEQGLGDCIDCHICVQVCPVGIDIRDGLQYECINCALCIDACDSVMTQMNYDKGLISYTTEHNLEGGKSKILRPRLIGYSVVVVILVSLFVSALFLRVPLKLDIIRDRDRLYTETFEGLIENTYTLKVINMSQQPHRYRVTVEGIDGISIIGNDEINLNGSESIELPLRLNVDPVNLLRMSNEIQFKVETTDGADMQRTAESRFLGPRI